MKRLVFSLLPLAAIVLGIAVSGCAPEPAETESTPPPATVTEPATAPETTPTPAPAPVEPATTTDPAAASATDAAAPASTPMPAEGATATPAVATSGTPLDATTLIGTKWSAAGYELAFIENGALKINGDTDGTWKLENDKLTIDVGGTPYEAKIEGDKITYEGSPLERLN